MSVKDAEKPSQDDHTIESDNVIQAAVKGDQVMYGNFAEKLDIGQARLSGLEKDLKLVGNQYDVCLTVYVRSIANRQDLSLLL
jgi:hypothetical protein